MQLFKTQTLRSKQADQHCQVRLKHSARNAEYEVTSITSQQYNIQHERPVQYIMAHNLLRSVWYENTFHSTMQQYSHVTETNRPACGN